MSRINVEQIYPILIHAARHFRDRSAVGHSTEKGFGNYVTDADKAVQAEIREALAARYPAVQFYAEEKDNGDVDIHGDYWILDPIDGTLNLMHDYAHSAISLGYAEAGELVLGMIYDPYRDELFYGEQGQGAYLLQGASQAYHDGKLTDSVNMQNRTRIHVSGAQALADSVAIFGTAPYNRDAFGALYKESVWRVFDRCQDIRRFGAAVLDLAWVACGRAEVYFEHIYPWDRAAGIVIVREAGGKVCGYDGGEVPITGFHDVIAGTPAVVDEVVSITSEIFA